MTPVGLTRDAGWQVGVSRTLEAPLAAVWHLLVSPAGVATWLGRGVRVPDERGGDFETADGTAGWWRSVRAHDRLRLSWRPAAWDHDTTLQVAVVAAGPQRATLRIHQERLASAVERERQREHWTGVLDELAAALRR